MSKPSLAQSHRGTLGTWGAIINFLVGVLSLAAKGVTGEVGLDLLRQLVGLQKATPDALSRVEAKVALVGAEFQAGQQYLDDALVDWRKDAERLELLVNARDAFVMAEAQETSELRKSFAAMHLAGTWAALNGDVRDVERTLLRAHMHAARAADLTESGIWEPRKWIKTQFVPYLDALAQTRRAWGASPLEAPTFFVPPDDGSVSSLRDWRAWAAEYDRARTNGPKKSRAQIEAAAAVYGVDAKQLDENLDKVEEGSLRSVQFLDDWVASAP